MDRDTSSPAARNRQHTLPFALTCFVSALLLFLVQPLLGKFILPWFGGTPGVWTTAMLLFQALLLGGYLYAHICTRLLQRGLGRWVFSLHVALVVLSLGFLPIIPSDALRPHGSDAPIPRILLLLVRTVGVPYFLLAATGPLSQAWLSVRGGSPYRLYALSNAGSLLALFGYPLVMEPLFPVTTQAKLWSLGFGLLLPLWLLCAYQGLRKPALQAALPASSSPVLPPQADAERTQNKTETAMSILLPMLACGMLLSTTNHLCEDVAVIPFLWVLPLAIYLLSFILTFESERFYRRKRFAVLTLLAVALLLVSESFPSLLGPVLGQYAYVRSLFLSLVLLFSTCMICHGEVAQARPGAEHLTGYYLRISLGGVLGGVLLAVLSPLLLSHTAEWYGTLLGCYLIAISVRVIDEQDWTARIRTLFPAALGTVGILLALQHQHKRHPDTTILASVRNFYGEVQVHDRVPGRPDEHDRAMFHGGTIHGVQYQSAKFRRDPITYYDEASGIGQVFAQLENREHLHAGIVGLGIGTLATYARPGWRFRFYELNPVVEKLAQTYFTYLSSCSGTVSVVLGDARLSLTQETEQMFDLLVLDAFSGDAIPTHLLTQEALATYQRHLKPDGALVIHITNRYLDLAPVVRGLAEKGRFPVTRVRSPQDDPHEIYAADWMILSRSEALVSALRPHSSPIGTRPPILWTDESSPLLNLLLR